MPQSAITELGVALSKALDFFSSQLAEIRTSRANPAMLNSVRVEAYPGTPLMPLVELASISSSDPTLLLVRPWDPSVKDSISKAINAANLGFSSSIDGDVIRVPVPSLSQERRKEFAKLVVSRANEIKETIRSLRRDVLEILDKQKEDGDLPEDDYFRLKKEVQDQIDKANERVKELSEKKEQELMEV